MSENAVYETVIGLEVHVQLATKSKVFCGCSTAFGQPPNTATCPVCLGFPGVLPVLNREAFRYAIKVALGLHCTVQPIVKFDRKNYYYPDLPKAYQISQYDKPIAFSGSLRVTSLSGHKDISITRVHLEEDAGKLLHDQDKRSSVVDYNRAGTPLLEIVTEPEISSPDEAYAYLTTLKQRLLYLGVSDCNMEEGSLRCDANISVRPKGEKKLGVKSELKNMNSFKAVKAALEHEIVRHRELLSSGQAVVQETRLWDTDQAVTRTMRTKEEAHDYRYFPEPDLVPFHVSAVEIDEIRRTLPEMPEDKKKRFIKAFQLTEKEADTVTQDRALADYFEKAAALSGNAKTVFNWLKGDIMNELHTAGVSISAYTFTPEMLTELIGLIDAGTISGKMAKQLMRDCAREKMSPKAMAGKLDLHQISDSSALEGVIEKVVAENERSVNDFKKGKENALMFLIGQVMRHTKGKANPQVVNDLLREKLRT